MTLGFLHTRKIQKNVTPTSLAVSCTRYIEDSFIIFWWLFWGLPLTTENSDEYQPNFHPSFPAVCTHHVHPPGYAGIAIDCILCTVWSMQTVLLTQLCPKSKKIYRSLYIVCLLKSLVISFFILTKLSSKVRYKLVVVHSSWVLRSGITSSYITRGSFILLVISEGTVSRYRNLDWQLSFSILNMFSSCAFGLSIF